LDSSETTTNTLQTQFKEVISDVQVSTGSFSIPIVQARDKNQVGKPLMGLPTFCVQLGLLEQLS
jgi:hypothetical protein